MDPREDTSSSREGWRAELTRRLTHTDPRHYQIVSLSMLLAFGAWRLGFPVTPGRVAVTVSTALLAQWVGERLLLRRASWEPRSAMISSLSLLLILRTGSDGTMALAAALAVGSKFLLRVRGKHVFNPANFGIVVAVLMTDDAWISPGQWGSASLLLVLFAGLGLAVTTRARRLDIALAFLGSWAAVLFGRALWLGDPLAIPTRSLQSGTLLLFAFFMITDPRTTPDDRWGRLAFAPAVALLAGWITFGLHQPNAFLWALPVLLPMVPLLDLIGSGRRHRWPRRAVRTSASPQSLVPSTEKKGTLAMTHPVRRTPTVSAVRRLTILFAAFALLVLAASGARAFCGFYVAKADTDLFNRASEVILVRDGDRTVITMSNDFRGEPREFAMVIPVPTAIEREQIHVADRALIDHLDAYTSPRLVEYFDADPCRRELRRDRVLASAAPLEESEVGVSDDADALGVTIEASYTVGEYDILILSAEQSDGLATWLRSNDYRLPDGAEPVLESYLAQDMRFFVAKVNVEEQSRLGFQRLRPLQIAYESAKFMLPIRLGTLNADGDQELFVYTLTRRGRVETTNYRTIRLPTGGEIPTFVEDDFGEFYRDLFEQQVEREPRGVFLEYAWDMAWCDPCAADPLSAEELRELGVFWIDASAGESVRPRRGGPQDVFVTRLHLRYNSRTFPADLRFQETADRSNFQGRYVLRHPWKGDATCPAAQEYRRGLERRLEEEAQRLASLTGWSIDEIRRRIRSEHRGLLDGGGEPTEPAEEEEEPWWRRLWPGRRR